MNLRTIACTVSLLCACEANEVVLDAVPDSLPDTEAGGIAADIISVLDSSLAPDAGMDTHAGQHKDTVDRIPVDDSSSFEPSDTSQIDADLGDTYDGPPIVGLAEAKALYGTYCSLCHGPNGEGYLADGANQLNNQSWLATVSDEHIQAAIAIGRPSTTMSSWSKTYAGPLTGVETQALVKLIRGWQTEPYIELPNEPIIGSASRGAGVWEFHCASCHGTDGSGGPFSALGNAVLLSTASDAFLRYAIAKGRPGTPMPGYDNILTSQAIDDLVVLMRSWSADIQPPPTELPNDDAPAVLNPSAENAALGDDFYSPLDTIFAEYSAGKRLTIIDARPPGDYIEEHISGAISVPFYAVEDHLDRLDKAVPIVAYCACPHAESGTAASALQSQGFTLVHVLDEGFFAWRDTGLPTATGPNP